MPYFFAVLCREELDPFSVGWGSGLGLLRVLDKDNSSFNARVIIIILLSRDLNHNFVRFSSLPSEAVSRARKRANLSREGSNAEIVQSQVVTSLAFTSQFSQASNRADFFFLSIIFAAKKSSKTLRLSFKNLRLLVFAKKMSKI